MSLISGFLLAVTCRICPERALWWTFHPSINASFHLVENAPISFGDEGLDSHPGAIKHIGRQTHTHECAHLHILICTRTLTSPPSPPTTTSSNYAFCLDSINLSTKTFQVICRDTPRCVTIVLSSILKQQKNHLVANSRL